MLVPALLLYLIADRFVQFVVALERAILIFYSLTKVNCFMFLSLLAIARGPGLPPMLECLGWSLFVASIGFGFQRHQLRSTALGLAALRDLVLHPIVPRLYGQGAVVSMDVCRIEFLAVDHVQLVRA